MSGKIGVALSGGGYRAAAFHLGTLRALNRLGILSKIDVISSVSGGSIIAAYYGLHNDIDFDTFEKEFRKGLRKSSLFGCITNLIIIMAIPPILSWLVCSWLLWLYLLLIPLGFTLIPSSNWIEYAYDKIFFKESKIERFAGKTNNWH